MKKYLILIGFALSFFTAEAQKVYSIWPIKYGRQDPTFSPRVGENHTWFNTNGGLKVFNRAEAAWEDVSTQASYAEISISNDTSTISFAATTAAPLQDLTAGPLRGFSIVSDSVLKYNGAETAVFSINYSASISFAEASNIISGWVEVNGTTQLRSRFRQTITTLTAEREMVSGTCLVTLPPGALIRFMMVPSAHTGTDVLTVYEFNLNIRKLN